MGMPETLLEGLDLDRPLFEALRAGDDSVLPELMQRHGRWVRGVIFAVLGQSRDLEDVNQQVWLAVWRRAATLDDVGRWRWWLYRLAHNAAIDAGRRATRQKSLWKRLAQWAGRAEAMTAGGWSAAGLSGGGGGAGRASGGAARLILEEEHQRALRAIAGMPAIYREPFVLRHLEGWNYRQIAQTLGLPVDTVETRLVRARRMLREQLEREEW
jgi:RNA polymerase sigma-70 factor, ECF subfamily